MSRRLSPKRAAELEAAELLDEKRHALADRWRRCYGPMPWDPIMRESSARDMSAEQIASYYHDNLQGFRAHLLGLRLDLRSVGLKTVPVKTVEYGRWENGKFVEGGEVA